MAGLLLGGLVLRQTALSGLPAGLGKGALAPADEHHLQRAASAFVVAAACDGVGPAAGLGAAGSATGGGALATVLAVSHPPRTYNHTRRLTVPAYCLAGTRTRRRRGPRGGSGGGDDELWGGGGDDGGWGGGFWDGGGDGEGDEEGDGSLAARLQDLLLLWGVFCTLAFAQAVLYVSPKPKAPPAFAALSYSGIKAQLLQRAARAAA